MGRTYKQELPGRVVEAAGSQALRGRCRDGGPLDDDADHDWGNSSPAARADTPLQARSAEAYLLSLPAERHDITREEMRTSLQEDHALPVGLSTL